MQALRPDLVIIGAYYPESTKALASAGIVTVAFNFHNRSTIDSIKLIGKAIGAENEADQLVTYFTKIETEITSITSSVQRANRPKVMYQASSAGAGLVTTFHTGGNQAFQHTLIERAGGINIG